MRDDPSDLLQPVVADPKCLEVRDCRGNVVLVRAGDAGRACDGCGRFRRVEVAGILPVRPVDRIAERLDQFPAGEADGQEPLQIDAGDEFPPAQVVHHLFAQFAGHPVGEADAGAAPVEAEHQAWTLLRSPVDPGIDAKRPMIAVQARAARLDMGKTRTPHQ